MAWAVAPASYRLARGHPDLAGADETPARQPPGTAALRI